MFQTLHKPCTKLYIQFLNTNQTNQTVEANGTNEREWIVRNASIVRNERDERNERNERDGAVTGWWRCQRGVTEATREQSFIISFKGAPFLKH